MTLRRGNGAARRAIPVLERGERAGDIEVGIVSITAGARLPHLTLNEIEALTVLEGSLVVRSGNQVSTTIAAGTGIVRRLATPVSVAAVADTMLIVARLATPASAAPEPGRGRAWCSLPSPATEALRDLHRALAASPRAGSRLVEGLAMVAMAWAESALAGHGEVAEKPYWFDRVTERLHDPVARPTILALAREAGVTPTHLARVFRQIQGCTVTEYHRRVRIDAACRLMQDVDLPLSVIATATGFADHAHLSKAFRKAIGVPPREYRRATAAASAAGGPAPPSFEPAGRYVFRSRTSDGRPYDGVLVIERTGSTLGGVVETSIMPAVPIETIAVHGRRMVLTARVPAGLAILDLRLRGAELEGEWRLAGKGTAVRGRRSEGGS